MNTKIIFSGIYANVIGGNVVKYVDIYNRNFYRIYFHLYLGNNFNYCTILMITYFRAFLDIIFSGREILFILEKLLLNKFKTYNMILNKS